MLVNWSSFPSENLETKFQWKNAICRLWAPQYGPIRRLVVVNSFNVERWSLSWPCCDFGNASNQLPGSLTGWFFKNVRTGWAPLNPLQPEISWSEIFDIPSVIAPTTSSFGERKYLKNSARTSRHSMLIYKFKRRIQINVCWRVTV